MKDLLSKAGGFMALVGVISTILYFVGYNLKILMWVDLWGPTVGWVIRGGLIVGGAALFFVFMGGDDEDDD